MKLSKVARPFIAGLLTHAREYTAVTNQWVNSYKRLFPQALPTGSPRRRRTSAGVTSTGPRWCGCRPTASRTRPGSRSARSTRACNPYLAFAVLLGAGLKGIEEGYELPPGAEDDVWSLSDAERRAMGYETLPENLAEAIDVMAKLGARRRDARRARLRLLPAQQAQPSGRSTAGVVTPYERQRYLGAL